MKISNYFPLLCNDSNLSHKFAVIKKCAVFSIFFIYDHSRKHDVVLSRFTQNLGYDSP